MAESQSIIAPTIARQQATELKANGVTGKRFNKRIWRFHTSPLRHQGKLKSPKHLGHTFMGGTLRSAMKKSSNVSWAAWIAYHGAKHQKAGVIMGRKPEDMVVGMLYNDAKATGFLNIGAI
eukprot:702255-Pelagomonas_calceolata.AAC.6